MDVFLTHGEIHKLTNDGPPDNWFRVTDIGRAT